ncbi:MAG: Macrolide export ATP-binding/permease protein MacB [Chloroflexi bacterium ADurb.Bin180]|nr:MAG: Macrolide export ATP-binding/permease protein MacB [Chloroflexi bacterium ADurb.Bin180]
MRRLVNFWFALLGLRTNKLRSGLTMLGVVIGVGAVIMIVSLGNGLRRSTQEQMEAWSAGTVEIRPQFMPYMGVMPLEMEASSLAASVKGAALPGPGVPQQSQPRGLEAQDVEALRRLATRVVAITPLYEGWAQVIYKGQYVPNPGIDGVLPEYLTVFRTTMKYGRFVTLEDNDQAAAVVVLDESLVDQVWGKGANPVGETLRIVQSDVPQVFTIIGVTSRRPGVVGIANRAVLLPLHTAQMRLSTEGKTIISYIAARVDDRDSARRKTAVAEINTILRARRGIAAGSPEDFMVQDTLQWSEESMAIIRTITVILSAIAGISLVVGSIGLMNIMLVGVAERTWEIGLRRSVGAEKSDILLQFLSEGVLIALLGGAGGLALGLGGSYVASRLIEQVKGMATVSAEVVAIAVIVSLIVGVLASIYPAWRAASLQPTAALRRG